MYYRNRSLAEIIQNHKIAFIWFFALLIAIEAIVIYNANKYAFLRDGGSLMWGVAFIYLSFWIGTIGMADAKMGDDFFNYFVTAALPLIIALLGAFMINKYEMTYLAMLASSQGCELPVSP